MVPSPPVTRTFIAHLTSPQARQEPLARVPQEQPEQAPQERREQERREQERQAQLQEPREPQALREQPGARVPQESQVRFRPRAPPRAP